jgi:hypothetical protein
MEAKGRSRLLLFGRQNASDEALSARAHQDLMDTADLTNVGPDVEGKWKRPKRSHVCQVEPQALLRKYFPSDETSDHH